MKNRELDNNKIRDRKIMFLLVMASFAFLIGSIVYKGMEKKTDILVEKIEEPAVDSEMKKLEEETLSDSEIDSILIEAEMKMKSSPLEARRLLERIRRYRGKAAYYLASKDYEGNNIDKALEGFRESVQLGYVQGMYEIGEIYILKKQYGEAEKWLLKAEVQGNHRASEKLEEIYRVQGNNVRREEKLLTLTRQNKVKYMYELGKIYIQKKRYIEAREIFIKLKEYNILKASGRINDIDVLMKDEDNGKLADEKILQLERNHKRPVTDLIFREAVRLLYSNPEKSRFYLEKIEKYRIEASAYLAEYYMEKGDRDNAEKWLLISAGRGHIASMYELGELYNDNGNYREAEKWYRKAAENKSVAALTRIGDIYSRAGNIPEARKWYRKGAEKGERDAQYILAMLYMADGNLEEGEKLLLKSVEKVNIHAIIALSEKYYREKKYDKAEILDEKLYSIGDISRSIPLGKYEEGKGKTQEAEKYYLSGARKGNIAAMYELAFFYDEIKGGKDKEKALEWYGKAAEEGDGKAMLSLARIYEEDFKDTGLAQKWYLKALKNGRLDAKKKLKEIKD